MNWRLVILATFVVILIAIGLRSFIHPIVPLVKVIPTDFKPDNHKMDSLTTIIDHQSKIIEGLVAERDTVYIKITKTLSLPITQESKKEAVQWAIQHSTK